MSLTLTHSIATGATKSGHNAAMLLGFSLPISTAVDNLLLVIVLVSWLLIGHWREVWEDIRQSPVALILLALLLLAAIGTTWGFGSSAERLRYFGKYANLLLAVCLITRPLGAEQKRRAAAGFGLAILLSVALSYAIRFGFSPPLWLTANRDPANPVAFKAQITHGFFVALGSFLFLIAALHATDRRWRWAFAIAAGLATINVLMTQGRTGHLVLLGLTGYLFLHRFRWRGALAAVVAVIAMAVLALQFPSSAVVNRLDQGIKEVQQWEYGRADESSMGLRMQFAATSLRIIAQNPVFGVGTGGFEDAYRAEISKTEARVSNNPHNQYLLSTVQFGVFGLAALLGVFIVLWREAAHLVPAEMLLARGVLIAYAIGNLFNSFLFDHAEALFFAWAVGLLFCRPALPDKARSVRLPPA